MNSSLQTIGKIKPCGIDSTLQKKLNQVSCERAIHTVEHKKSCVTKQQEMKKIRQQGVAGADVAGTEEV
jgi:hypothetical protein